MSFVLFAMAGGSSAQAGVYARILCPDGWFFSDPPSDCPTIVPPDSLFQPVCGFGLVWRDEQALEGTRVRDRLGWAIHGEYAIGQGAIQCNSAPKYISCYLSGLGVGAGFARLGARTVSGRCARSSGDARLESEPAAAARAATVAGAGATRSVALATQTARDDGVERVDPRPRSVQAFLDAQLARGSPQAGGLEREKDTLARLHPGRRRSTVGTFSRAGRSR